MKSLPRPLSFRPSNSHGRQSAWGQPLLMGLLLAGLVGACTWQPPMVIRGDRDADRMVSALRQSNAGLTRLQCLGNVKLTGSDRSMQSLRAAIAGQRPDLLRIDMIAPFGGIVGTVASDGDHLFLLMHRSGEYHKKRLGSGSLQRFIGVDVGVADVIDLMAGRVPIESGLAAQPAADGANGGHRLELVDRYGRIHQRIALDAAGRPTESVWYDRGAAERYSAVLQDWRSVDGFMLPRRVVLSGATGSTVAVTVDRCLVNVDFDPGLFTLTPPVD